MHGGGEQPLRSISASPRDHDLPTLLAEWSTESRSQLAA
jgi:hypothetical protein